MYHKIHTNKTINKIYQKVNFKFLHNLSKYHPQIKQMHLF